MSTGANRRRPWRHPWLQCSAAKDGLSGVRALPAGVSSFVPACHVAGERSCSPRYTRTPGSCAESRSFTYLLLQLHDSQCPDGRHGMILAGGKVSDDLPYYVAGLYRSPSPGRKTGGESPTLYGRGRHLAAETFPVGSHDSGQRRPLLTHDAGVVSRSRGLRVQVAAVGATRREMVVVFRSRCPSRTPMLRRKSRRQVEDLTTFLKNFESPREAKLPPTA